MSIPYIGFTNNHLNAMPKVKSGDSIICHICGGEHILQASKDEKGNDSEMLLFFECGDNLYLGAVDGRCTIKQKADISGEI